MLKQETYEIAAEVFGTVIGVASVVRYKKIEVSNEVKRKSTDEMMINTITQRAIDFGKYQRLHRMIYKLRSDKRKKELTIYKEAWKAITNNNDER